MNEETGNRRPVMLSVITRSEKEAQAAASSQEQPAAGATTTGSDVKAKQSPKGMTCVSIFFTSGFQSFSICQCNEVC